MAKMLAFDQEAQEAMRRGVSKLARAVRVTLGPRGRNVILEKSFGSPTVTKDGVTVAREIELSDKFEDMGARMVKEVASKTSDVAGDGTTTATIMAEAIYNEGLKAVVAGVSPVEMKRGMEQAVEDIEPVGREVLCLVDDDRVEQVGDPVSTVGKHLERLGVPPVGVGVGRRLKGAEPRQGEQRPLERTDRQQVVLRC